MICRHPPFPNRLRFLVVDGEPCHVFKSVGCVVFILLEAVVLSWIYLHT